MAGNKRVPELPNKGSVEPNNKFVIYDEPTDTTYHVNAEDMLPSTTIPADAWSPDDEYLEGAIKSYEGNAYIATDEPGNINKIPPLFPDFWEPVDKQTSAGIKMWAAGLYEATDVSVYKVISGALRLARLASATRPYNSLDFDAELALGDWELAAGGGATTFLGIFVSLAALQAAHPTAADGSYAYVDAGVASDVQLYIWDSDDTDWIQSGGGLFISSQAQADAGTDNLTAMSPLTTSRRAQKVFTGNVSGAVSIDLDTAEVFILTVTANITSFTFTNEKVGKQYTFIFKQGNTNYTITFTAAKFAFPFGNAPVLTSGLLLTYSKDIATALCTEAGKLDLVFTPNLVNN